jgi:hypothetical protein
MIDNHLESALHLWLSLEHEREALFHQIAGNPVQTLACRIPQVPELAPRKICKVIRCLKDLIPNL